MYHKIVEILVNFPVYLPRQKKKKIAAKVLVQNGHGMI